MAIILEGLPGVYRSKIDGSEIRVTQHFFVPHLVDVVYANGDEEMRRHEQVAENVELGLWEKILDH